jgi:phenylacetate-coenzyme A ligase PaaK-like adenylate-forming protein
MRSELIHNIFDKGIDFPRLALDIFQYQYNGNPLYQEFCHALNRNTENVRTLAEIPFLPISFFKSHQVKTGEWEAETWFESSGTTGTVNSSHQVRSLDLYRKSFLTTFRKFFGAPSEWCIIGLLPAYLERQHSSLVVMVDELIRLSGHEKSGFYLYDYAGLKDSLEYLERSGQKTLLIGVSFALLDLAEKFPIELRHTVIMETGGMKGRRREMTREELHAKLTNAFGVPVIHSEYGMTELFSQAYTLENGLFYPPSWMKILLREEDDPLKIIDLENREPHPSGGTRRVRQGVITIIDLANIDSCSFIATDDVGRIHSDGGFEVLGRIDTADIRGCSLMVI